MMGKISTRFVGNPEGVSNVFFTYFDNFFCGQYKLGEVEKHQRRGKPSNPPTNRSLGKIEVMSQTLLVIKVHCSVELIKIK